MRQNIWRELGPGPQPPDIVYALIEIPRGSRNKYEYDKELGIIRLDRLLYSSLVYPGDYGIIPGTFYDDGDPLDILVMVSQPTFPGCIIESRPIGLFEMLDGDLRDDKVLAVPASDPLFHGYHDISDIPPHYLKEASHFFQVYKDLEGVQVKPLGWQPAAIAKERIRYAVQLFQERCK